MTKKNSLIFYFTFMALLSCVNTSQEGTLADIDIEQATFNTTTKSRKAATAKTGDTRVKEAYYTYLSNAGKNEKTRLHALNRLAQLEFDLSSRLLQNEAENERIQNLVYQAGLRKTIELLETSLKDFPDSDNTDATLYQLARARAELGDAERAISALKRLAKSFPRSDHYPEAQFRIAEHTFARGDYISAEDAYTEVILSPLSDRFYEKSLFKRGWARYKQQIYNEALDDYFAAYHSSSDAKKKAGKDSDLRREYFRAMALALANIPGKNAIHTYFNSQTGFDQQFELYLTIADIYLKQERYSDADNVLVQFRTNNPNSKYLPESQIKSIAIWRQAGFIEKLQANIDIFYRLFAPDAGYWKNKEIPEETAKKMREYIVLAATTKHADYLNRTKKKEKQEAYYEAERWYKRYLSHFSAYANTFKLYSRYAELLLDVKRRKEALTYFELAAFDGDIILDKESAYSAISITNVLYEQSGNDSEKKQILAKQLSYSQQFAKLYPTDKRSKTIATRSAELSFANRDYEKALLFSSLVTQTEGRAKRFNIDNIRARAHLELSHFDIAEQLFTDMLQRGTLSSTQRKNIEDSLALAIYSQGEALRSTSASDAYHHYARVSIIVPRSDIAPKGLYDAIAIAVKSKQWPQAIKDIERFNVLYPKHSLSKDVSKNLTLAYLKSDQTEKAASQYIILARDENDNKVRMAALWKAAQLFEQKKLFSKAILAYRDYANEFYRPYPENIEAMYKLVELYGKTKSNKKRYFWQNRIRTVDARTPKEHKTDRTEFITASVIINLAESKREEFDGVKLRAPFAANLKKKKKAMQEAVTLYGKASSFGLEEVATQSTFQIGAIYHHFSQSLLQSERPSNLNADELEQYNILLEDQAFPFEDKAIEFYETNLSRIPEGISNKWINASLEKLKELFPARYQRSGKIGVLRDTI